MKETSNKSPALADLFHVGQLVRAIIIGLDQQPRAGASNSKSGKKTIRLSLQVSQVNSALTPEAVQHNVPLSACVTSVEDHGYTLSFGIKGIAGFLSKKNQGSGKQEDAAGLKPGMLIECVAQSQKAKQKTVKVTAAPAVVTDTVTEDYPGLSIGKTHLTCLGWMPVLTWLLYLLLRQLSSNAHGNKIAGSWMGNILHAQMPAEVPMTLQLQ